LNILIKKLSFKNCDQILLTNYIHLKKPKSKFFRKLKMGGKPPKQEPPPPPKPVKGSSFIKLKADL